jgi:hypothetical protein
MRAAAGVIVAWSIFVSSVALGDDAVSPARCTPPPGTNPHDDASLAAPKKKAAEEHRKSGNAYHRAGDFTRATEEFTAGALIEPAPVFLYSLAQSYRLAGDYERAIYEYQLFLDRGRPGAALRELVECNMASMRAELDHAAQTAPPLDTPPDAPPTAERSQPATLQLAAPPRWHQDTVGWSVTGFGVVASAAGGAILLNAASLDEDANREDREAMRDVLRDRADTRRTWGYAIAATGAVAVVFGVVKLALTPDASPSLERRGPTLVLGPRSIGLVGEF